jgi:hypothetical protein
MPFSELCERIERLHHMLLDPHPGLPTYMESVGQQMDELTVRWKEGPEDARNSAALATNTPVH